MSKIGGSGNPVRSTRLSPMNSLIILYCIYVVVPISLFFRFVPTHLRVKRDDHKKDGVKRKDELGAMYAKPKVHIFLDQS